MMRAALRAMMIMISSMLLAAGVYNAVIGNGMACLIAVAGASLFPPLYHVYVRVEEWAKKA